jgi:hypothetical protein
MSLKYTYADKIAVSAFTKETSYDTALTVNDTNFYQPQEVDGIRINYADKRRDEAANGTELGGEGFLVAKDVSISLSLPFLRPTDLAWIAAYGLGTTAATQDGALAAYRHKGTRGDSIPSFNVLVLEAGIQTLLTGCKINTVEIKRSGEFLAATVGIVGSGRRTANADTFPSTIAESPLRYGDCSVWAETGADVDIAAAPSQGAENISAATPDDFKARVTGDFTFSLDNKLRVDRGFDASNASDTYCRGQLDRGAKREMSVTFPLTFEAATEETNFLAQTHYAVELNCKATSLGVIATTGAMYYGGIIILSRAVLDTIGEAGDDDGIKTRTLKFIPKEPTAADENTTEPVFIYAYNAQAAFAG